MKGGAYASCFHQRCGSAGRLQQRATTQRRAAFSVEEVYILQPRNVGIEGAEDILGVDEVEPETGGKQARSGERGGAGEERGAPNQAYVCSIAFSPVCLLTRFARRCNPSYAAYL